MKKNTQTEITNEELWALIAKVRTGKIDVWTAAAKSNIDAKVLWAWANGEAV